jgi:hypothetical protein
MRQDNNLNALVSSLQKEQLPWPWYVTRGGFLRAGRFYLGGTGIGIAVCGLVQQGSGVFE